MVCSIAKNENQYLSEWVEYHLSIGVSRIYIYDNNDVDGERVNDAFGQSTISSHVSVIDVRGKKFVQKKVYDEFYKTYEFDWCAFIDIDEFITLPANGSCHDVSAFLADCAGFDAVHLNWQCFGDNGHIRKSEAAVLQRFTKPLTPFDFKYTYITIPENCHIKSIIRKGLNISWISGTDEWGSNPHTPNGLQNVCNARKEKIPNSPFSDICFDGAYIRHYMTKSLEEYAVKIQRQCADCEANFYSYPKYFRANRLTVKKVAFLKRQGFIKNVRPLLSESIKYWFLNHGIRLSFLFKSLRHERTV